MKKILLLAIFAISSTFAFSQIKVIKGERPPIKLEEVSPDAYEISKIQIKLKPGMEKSIPDAVYKAGKGGFVVTGIKSIDNLNEKFGANKYTPLLDGLYEKSAKSVQNREKHKAWGFHLWFTVEVNTKAEVIEIVKKYAALDEVEIAEPIYKKKLISNVPPKEKEATETKESKWTPNDPRFDEQWHYHNTGQEGGTVDKDIDLPEAWEIEKGNSSVIVAVVDGGIQTNHPDLAANIWSGVGYNFVTNSSTLSAEDHGTHVAGTIAGVNNNGTGVSGVAGGSGSGDGVRLMSCQVFTSSSSGGFDQAPIYAADNGAAISQNSWGYTSEGVYDQATLDAIDYFNANGGGDVLDGGITIFAAGNNDATGDWYPGCYSGAFAVAATNNNDVRSYYSNYGSWVDISAPGGEQSASNDPKGILSTLASNSYGFYQGTSMACPHVSGVAALLISNAVRNGVTLTNSQVADLLKNNVDDHYAVNSSYTGQLGSGRLNANLALEALQSMFTNEPPSTPTGLATTNITDESATLSWSAATGATSYDVQLRVQGGSWSTYNVSGTSYNANNLSAETTYEWQVRAKNTYGTSSYSAIKTFSTTEFVVSYCESKGNNSSYEWIAEVEIGSFNNTSSAAGYTNFTNLSIEMEPGTNYSVSLTPGFGSSTYNEYWKIWIDLNGDGDFDDTNELIFDAGSLSKTIVTGTITIPEGTAAITTRMRVSMKYNAAQTACETFSYGEVEDYTVVITESGEDTQAPTAPTNLSASNISESSFTLSWNASTDNVGVTGYDVYQNGSLLNSVTGTSANISGLSAGTTYNYYVKAKDAAGNISAESSTLQVTTNEPADTEAPTAPSNLSSSNVGETSVTLSWTASTDNVGVTGYDIYRDGSVMASTDNTSYNVSGLTAATTYSFYVTAKDAAGNVSAASNTLDVTTLAGNTAPVADAGGPYSGDQGTAISFDGTGSSDADGDALTYNWNFGDGYTGTGATPTHTYATAGSYTATLTVSDGIDSDQSTASVTVNSTTVDQPMISAISLSTRTTGPWNRVSGTVTITSNSQPLSNAFVEGYWSDGVSSSVSGYTGSDGTLLLEELKSKSSSFTFTITNVTLSGYYWDIENSQISASTSSQSISTKTFSSQLPFNVYPNPVTNGSLTITLAEIGSGVEIVIYDINGSARITKQLTNVVSEIPVQELSAGVYILKVEGHNEPQRIIIK